MAWRRYGRRRGYRRYSSRRWGRSRRFSRRYRRYRRRSGTRSSVVKLSGQATFQMQGSSSVNPIVFSPASLPGFMDYYSVYSQFRVIKASLKVHLETSPVQVPTGGTAATTTQVLTNQPWTFLKVSSRPFVESIGQAGSIYADGTTDNFIHNSPLSALPVQRSVTELRQSKWQKQFYPSDVRNVLSFRFKPYTLSWAGMPYQTDQANGSAASTQRGTSYLRAMKPGSWMPMTFSGVTNAALPGTASQQANSVVFFGPYLARLQSSLGDSQQLQPWSPSCTLTLYVQFRGQK